MRQSISKTIKATRAAIVSTGYQPSRAELPSPIGRGISSSYIALFSSQGTDVPLDAGRSASMLYGCRRLQGRDNGRLSPAMSLDHAPALNR